MFAAPILLHSRPVEAVRPQKRPLSQAEIEEIAFAFSTLDVEKTGFVSARQVKVIQPGEVFPVPCKVAHGMQSHALKSPASHHAHGPY